MSSMTQHEEGIGQPSADEAGILSKNTNAMISVLFVVLGGLSVGLGALVTQFATLERISSWVASGRLTSTDMTDAQLIDTVYGLLWGAGVTIAVTGGLLVLGGLAYYSLQSRARQRVERTGEPAQSNLAIALLGGMVSLVAWFVPLVPALGGAVTGYLARDEAADRRLLGLIPGLIATVPITVLFALVIWSIMGSASGLTALVVAALGIALVVVVGYMIGLSLLGAYLGRSLAADRELSA